MKKLLVALFAVAMVAGLAAQLTPAISGDGWAEWGYNLNTNKHGFMNNFDLTIDVPLVVDGKAASTGEGNYGAASASGINVTIEAVSTDGVPAALALDVALTASVYVGPLSILLYSAPSISLDNALVFSPFQDDDADFDATLWSGNVAPGAATHGGLTLGYAIGELGSVSLAVASIGDWGAEPEGTPGDPVTVLVVGTGLEVVATGVTYTTLAGAAQAVPLPAGQAFLKTTTGAAAAAGSAGDQYAFQVGLTLTPMENASVTLGALYNGSAETIGASVGLSMKPISMLTLNAAFDLSMVGAATGYDASASVGVALTEKDMVKVALYYSAGAAGDGSEVDVMASFSDAEGFVPGLSLGASVYAMELLADPAKNPMWLGVAQNLSYKLALSDTVSITPYEKFIMDMASENNYLSVGATIVPFANTTIAVDFTMGSSANKAFPGAGFLATGMDDDKGILTITTTVSF